MGSIQTGQIVNKPIQQGSIQAGRISRGITSYDEQIRQGYLSKIDAQKKAYQDEVDKINAQNLEIANKNAELKASYDKVVNDIKGMTTQQYNTYYYTIPESVKGLFESPEQINIRAAEQKQILAAEQKNTINSMIADYQTQYTYWMNEYNKRSGDSADYADRQRIQAEFHMQELQQALSYATGEYNTEEIIQVAQQRASDRVSQSEMSTDYSRIQEAEIQANVQKGLEPVYDYPTAINKTLLGYRDTTTITDIPQSSIKVGLSKALAPNEYYTDALGNPISYNPDLAKQPIWYLNQPKESKQYTPFEKSKLSPFFSKSTSSNLESFPKKTTSLGGLKTSKFKLPYETRGTIGSNRENFVFDYGKPQGFNDFIIGGIEGLTDITTKGYERLFTETLGQPLKQDVYFNLPYENRGTININAKPQKIETVSIFGGAAKVLGQSPQIALWTFAPEVIAAPYVIRGTKTALNPNLSSIQRLSGGIEAGTSIAFGYGREIVKLIPKNIKEVIPSSKVIIETTKLKAPTKESIIGVNQINPVEVYEDVYGRQLTKYNYNIGTISPEIKSTTGKITKISKQSLFGDMFGLKPKVIYEGNPYIDKLGYKKSIELLKKTGTTEQQAKNIIRLTAPKVSKYTISGEGYSLFGEDLMKPITKIKVQNKVTPEIMNINGVKTRNFKSVDYFVNSKGIEIGDMNGISIYKSTPEYTKTYLTKEGGIYQNLKDVGKTKEVFTQISGIKNLGSKELKLPVQDIGYAKSYISKELELSQDLSFSRKIIPNERAWNPSRSKILSSNIEEPIVITYESPFKVTKEIKTGSVTGTSFKREGSQQQQMFQKYGTSFKPLDLVSDAKQNLIKEQQRVSNEILKLSVPSTLEIKNIIIKPVVIKETKQVAIPKTLGTLGTNPFKDLTGQGKMESLTGTGKYSNLGVFEGRLGGSSLESDSGNKKETGGGRIIIKRTSEEKKIIDTPIIRDYTKELGKIKPKEDSEFKIKQPTQPKFKELEILKQKQNQETVEKTKDIFKNPPLNKPRGKSPEIDIRIKPPRTIINIPKTSTQSKRVNDILSKAFTVLIRSKGKVHEIGWNLPKGKALKLGVEKSKSSLAQTFALRESGTTKLTDINYRVPENLFTQPKRTKTRITPITFVERRGKTLTHYPEVKGLQQSKRKIISKWL